VFITFLSDFGLKDDFVGTCHGVMKRIAPESQIIDITHGIPPTSILQGALVLANTIDFMPIGVHLAIVDPGVGGPRRPLALRDAEGRLYVGPDNGLLLPAASRQGVDQAHELANPEYALGSISRTFHGRDLFAPAAAHLATGVPLEELGRLPGVTRAELRGESVLLVCSDSDQAIRALIERFPGARDIEIAGAGLEEAFLQLTAPERPAP